MNEVERMIVDHPSRLLQNHMCNKFCSSKTISEIPLITSQWNLGWQNILLASFWKVLNTLRAAKRGLMSLEIFYLQKHFFENIWRRIDDQKTNNNSPSNSLRTSAIFTSYFQKYESSRRFLQEKLWVWMF